jgi:hypothetical protein
LFAEEHHTILPERSFDLFVYVFGPSAVQVYAADHAANGRRQGVDLDVTEAHFLSP